MKEVINCCFIASQKRSYDLPDFLDKENTLFFPESRMSTHDLLHSGRPDGFNIVTDSHLLVSLYSRHEVFYYDETKKEWVNPDFQTYGTSYYIILHNLWDYHSSIPMAVINGKTTNVMGFKVKQ